MIITSKTNLISIKNDVDGGLFTATAKSTSQKNPSAIPFVEIFDIFVTRFRVPRSRTGNDANRHREITLFYKNKNLSAKNRPKIVG